MVDLLLQIQEKWDCGVIDLWNNEELNNITDEERSLYMLDGIHPTRAGYLHWWLPTIEAYLESIITDKKKILVLGIRLHRLHNKSRKDLEQSTVPAFDYA